MSKDQKDLDVEELAQQLLSKGPNEETATFGHTARNERRKKRMELEKKQISIRLDQDLIEQFKELSGGKGYQSLINQALREWLTAKDIKELIAEELETLSHRLSSQIVSSVEEKLKAA